MKSAKDILEKSLISEVWNPIKIREFVEPMIPVPKAYHLLYVILPFFHLTSPKPTSEGLN